MRIAHEAPLCIFDQVQKVTDGDYALVHLFEENEEYFNKFKEAIGKGRHVILDNSVFELEEAFDSDRFLYWINRLQPSEFIIPDVLEDSYSTIQRLDEWLELYQPQVKTSSKTIGVVQARNYDDFVWCYNIIAPKVDKIAISFDYSFMLSNDLDSPLNKFELFVLGRRQLLRDLVRDKVIDESKPHHLLGCFLPQEFEAYKAYNWIDTIDTSNPVVAGIKGIRYTARGLMTKPSQKLYTMMDDTLTDKQVEDIMYNIQVFKGFCK